MAEEKKQLKFKIRGKAYTLVKNSKGEVIIADCIVTGKIYSNKDKELTQYIVNVPFSKDEVHRIDDSNLFSSEEDALEQIKKDESI